MTRPCEVLFATLTAGSLLVGAAPGSFRKPPQAWRGSMLALGVGALVIAVSTVASFIGVYDANLVET